LTPASSRSYAGWLAIVRILTGAIWIIHAVPKFLHPDKFMPPNGAFAAYLQHGIASTTGPYHDFLASTVVPNADLFAQLTRFGELLVGISLVLGLFARLGGFFGVFLPLNYMAARGAVSTVSGWGSPDACLALLSLMSLVLPTGRVAGFDGLRTPRPARRVTVVPEVVPERPFDRPSAPQP
jgi:thiosulfate dehydrogenase (quinone) large subunit